MAGAACALACVLASGARAQDAAADPPSDRLRFSAPMNGRLGVGMMDGYLTLHGLAGFVLASGQVTPTLENRRVRIRMPVSLSHRQTVGTPWTQSTGEASVAVRYSPIRRFRVEVSGGAYARLRKAWLDQYQPITVDHLSHTHRYSHWSRFLEVEASGMPVRRHHARIGYHYEYSDYWADPNYDPWNRPTHLVPMDRTEHRLDASWHYLKGPVRVGGEIVARHRNYYFAFARDAGSGATHAALGGLDPNPLYRVWYTEPQVDARLDASDEVRIRLAYGHEVQVDTFQGYFSYQGPHPGITLEFKPTPAFSFEVEADARFRRYGPNSYQAIGSHPPLEDGNRRYAHRYHARVALAYEANEHVSVYGEASLVVRSTNRPDYVPGVNPVSQQYDIDLDYTNVMASAGLRLSR